MKIKIEMEIENCTNCPFTVQVREQGYSARECTKLGCYSAIPNKGIRKDCPFIEKTLDK